MSKQDKTSKTPATENEGVIPRSKRFAVFLPVMLCILVLDLVTKWLIFRAASATIVDGQVTRARVIKVIEDCFELQCVMNPGAFSGWFGGWFWFLIIVSVGALGAIVGFVALGRIRNWSFLVSLALIAGGTAGNLYDRSVYGAVRDFFHFFISGTSLSWPNFNVADAAICVGVGLWILVELRTGRKAKHEAPAKG